jgi:hypothetical protein
VLRRAAVLVFATLLAGCTQDIVLQDLPDASDRDAGTKKDTAASGGDDAWCAPGWQWLGYEPRVAQLLLAFDRSAGMQTAFGGTTRAEAAESVLMDAINKYQAKVLFGFEQFPADSTDPSYGECQRNGCCAGSVKVKPNWNAASSISGPLQCGDFGFPCPYPSYETASHAALQKIRDFYEARVPLKEENDHYVLLVTGSEPYCSSLPASNDACEQALDAANELGELGVRLVVLSVGYQPTSNSCLVRLSDTGSKLSVPVGMKTLYTPSGVSSLNAAITEIALTVAKTTCTMEFSDTPPDDATLVISVGQTLIPQVDSTSQNGWSFANSAHTRIILSGSACDLFVYSREAQFSAGYSCSRCGGSPPCPNSSSR